MANQYTHALPHGNMQLLQNQKQHQNGSPKVAATPSKPTKGTKKISNRTHRGDVVSDDSDGDDEGDGSANEDDDDDLDEPDSFALSGARRIGDGAAARLAGPSPADAEMLDDGQAVAGEEQSDDDYGAIDNISDGDESIADDDEKTVLRSAEKDLIAEFERAERPRTATAVTNEINEMSLNDSRRTSTQSEGSQLYDDLDLDLDFNEDPFRGLSSNDTLYQEMVGDAEGLLNNDLNFWRRDEMNDESRQSSVPSSVTQKRVRFDETTSSRASSMSSASEEDPREAFPDLFDGNDDPLQRHQALYMDENNAEAIQDHDNESIYDFEEDFERIAYEGEEDSDSNSDSSDYSSESEGDTTDEEDPEVFTARVKAMRNASGNANASTPASTPNSAPSTPVPSARRATPTLARSKTTNGRSSTSKTSDRRPKMGTFIRDPTKARVEADVQGSGVKVTLPPNPPEKDRAYWERARKAMGSRDGSPNGSMTCVRSTPRTASIPQRPFTARSTLGTMFDGNLDFLRNNDENGIAKELIMNARNSSTRASFASSTVTDDSNADFSSNVNMEDFVQLDDSDFDMDEPQSASVMSPGAESSFDGDILSTPGNNANLLGHFDQHRGLVSSFRNNQNHARHVSSLAAHPAQRAQTSEANALQKGRRAAANTPMTPARKNRASQDITGAGIKKVASPLVQKHRRSRGNSLSGIQQTLSLERLAHKNN